MTEPGSGPGALAPADADLGLWIRVNTNLSHDPRVWALRERLNYQPDLLATTRNVTGNVTSIALVTGLLVLLESQVAQHQTDGDLSSRPDGQLEHWAGWEGPPGLFAKAYRSLFCGSDGVITDWLARHDKLIQARAKGAARTRAYRERRRLQSVTPGDTSGDVTSDAFSGSATSQVTAGDAHNGNVNGDGEEKNTTTTARETDGASGAAGGASAAGAFVLRLTYFDGYPMAYAWAAEHEHRRQLLRMLASHAHAGAGGGQAGGLAVKSALSLCQLGLQGGLVERGQGVAMDGAGLEEALTQYLTSAQGAARGWNLRRFRRWLSGLREDDAAGAGARARGAPKVGQAEKGAAAEGTAASVWDQMAGTAGGGA